MEVVGTQIARNLQVFGGGQGGGSILLVDSDVTGSTDLNGGNADNTVFVDNANFVGDFLLQTGTGADTVNIGTGGDVTQVGLAEETRQGMKTETIVTIVDGHRVRHTVEVPYTYQVLVPIQRVIALAGGPVTFNGKVTANLGGGDDTLSLAIDAQVNFNRAATLNGQNGQNTANVHAANLVTLPKLERFQINEV